MTVVNPKSISGINSITTGSGSDNLLTIHTSDASSTERVRINSSGDVIVGSGITVSPDGDIFATGVTTSTTFVGALTGNVTGNVSGSSGSATGNAGGLTGTPNISCGTIAGSTGTFTGDVDIADKIVHTGDTDTAIRFPANNTITTETGGSERLRIDSAGKLLVGTTSGVNGFVDKFQIFHSDATAAITVKRASDNQYAPYLNFLKSRGSTNSAATVLQSGDIMGYIRFSGTDGTDTAEAATIQAHVDGTPGDNDMPGRLVFYTTADGAQNATERMRLDSAGNLKFNSGFGSVSTVYGCRAWIQLNQGGSQSITGSGGVSSINDEGTGTTKITFTTSMPDDNFAMVGGAQQSSDSSVNYGFSLCMQSYTTTYAILIYRPNASSDVKEDNSKIHVAFFR